MSLGLIVAPGLVSLPDIGSSEKPKADVVKTVSTPQKAKAPKVKATSKTSLKQQGYALDDDAPSAEQAKEKAAEAAAAKAAAAEKAKAEKAAVAKAKREAAQKEAEEKQVS